MKFLAYLTKGLREVAQEEINEKISNAEIEETSPKYIIFKAEEANISQILNLKTVDDAHILLKNEKLSENGNSNYLVENFPVQELKNRREVINRERSLKKEFSLTTSKYRNKSISLNKLEQKISKKLEDALEIKYSQENSDFDIRIHIDQEKLLISIRITKKPLYFREYRQEGSKGSLKTSIAAALCRILEPAEGDKIVDNFCGSGTILCEALNQGMKISGGDVDREAVKTARKNIRGIKPEAANRIKKLDATSTSQPKNSFDIAISNLPWGKQVELNALELYSEAIKEYSRILKPEAKILILGDHPEIAQKYMKKYFPEHQVSQIRLGFLGQNPAATYGFHPETV